MTNSFTTEKKSQKASPKFTPKIVEDNFCLQVEKVGKSYNGRPVLRDVSMRLRRGETVGLLGPNGAGKTSCFYIIAGMLAPDFGKVYIDGVDVTDDPMYLRARSGLGYLPQESSIFRGLSVEENILAVLEVIENNPSTREEIANTLMNEFSISHLRRAPAIALSGGERRRLEIARALACEPQYILLDEPLAGVDPVSVSEIADLIAQLKDKGLGVLITDHNVRETLRFVDKAYILHDGKVLLEGLPNEIISNEMVRKVYLGEKFTL